MHRDEFSDAIALADFSFSLFSGKFQILRRQSNRNERIDMSFVADARASIDDAMTVDANSVSENDIVAHNCVWPNHAVAANLSIWTDDRGRMNLTRLTLN